MMRAMRARVASLVVVVFMGWGGCGWGLASLAATRSIYGIFSSLSTVFFRISRFFFGVILGWQRGRQGERQYVEQFPILSLRPVRLVKRDFLDNPENLPSFQLFMKIG